MKNVLRIAVLLAGAAGPAHAERPVLRGAEAPRATDLLRAEKLAEQAEKRLKVPTARRAGWKKGGHGWEARGEAPERPDPVIIDVRPPRRRASSP
jgi:hypothetical protein